MRPVRHKGSNLVYRGPTPDIGDLWCQRVQPGQIRVVYELDDADRANIAAGARIELAMYSEPIPPVSMIVGLPKWWEPVGEHGWKDQTAENPEGTEAP